SISVGALAAQEWKPNGYRADTLDARLQVTCRSERWPGAESNHRQADFQPNQRFTHPNPRRPNTVISLITGCWRDALIWPRLARVGCFLAVSLVSLDVRLRRQQ